VPAVGAESVSPSLEGLRAVAGTTTAALARRSSARLLALSQGCAEVKAVGPASEMRSRVISRKLMSGQNSLNRSNDSSVLTWSLGLWLHLGVFSTPWPVVTGPWSLAKNGSLVETQGIVFSVLVSWAGRGCHMLL
jgi:hypothetical protein